jgi:hypothetical protein
MRIVPRTAYDQFSQYLFQFIIHSYLFILSFRVWGTDGIVNYAKTGKEEMKEGKENEEWKQAVKIAV